MVFGTSNVTTADLIDETRGLLRGDLRSQVNTLADPFTSMQTEMVLNFPVTGVQVGQVIEVDLTLYQVADVNTAEKVLGVVPVKTSSNHAAGAKATMRPTYSKQRIIVELNNELADLSTQGIYRIETVEGDDDGVIAPPTGALTVLDIWSREDDVLGETRRIPEARFDLVDTPSGIELRGPGQVDFAVFGCQLTTLSDATDTENVVDVTGIPATALDIPAYGAAMRLLASAEARRNVTDTQGDTRRAEEVPPGAISGALRNLAALRQSRVVAESQRIRQRYGYTKRVGV